MIRHLSFMSVMLVAALFGSFNTANASPVPEYEMKAAYLYNFATFTNWPTNVGDSAPNNEVRLCVLGNDSFGGALEKLTRSQTGSIHIALSYLSHIKDAKDCQILFIDASELKNAVDIVKQLEKSSILTVTDNDDLFRAGIMIGLYLDNKRLTFDVDYAKTQNAQLVISSKLLRVARKVHNKW